MKEEEPIRLGRITRKVEETLGWSLSNDVGVYFPAEEADTLALAHPQDYLSILHHLSKLIRCPQYVSSKPGGRDVLYLSYLTKKGQTIPVYLGLRLHGKPEKWMVSSFSWGEKKEEGPWLKIERKKRSSPRKGGGKTPLLSAQEVVEEKQKNEEAIHPSEG